MVVVWDARIVDEHEVGTRPTIVFVAKQRAIMWLCYV